MNLQIYLTKTSNEPVTVSVDLEQHTLVKPTTVISIERKIDTLRPYYLEIARYDPSLYLTGELTHKTYVTVDKILLDNFWEITDKNHWSKTIYSRSYKEYLEDKLVTWELSKDLYNNVLYFNGILRYKFTRPIRGMFF